MNNDEKSNEDLIIENIIIVTDGINNSFRPNNNYASWQNTSKGLKFIKNNKKDFYMGVNLWLQITQNQILNCKDDNLLKISLTQLPWISNLLKIKDLVKDINY